MFDDAATANPMFHRLDCAAAICALPLPAYAFGPTANMIHRLPLPTGVLGDVQLVRHLGTDVRALHRRVSAKGPLPGVRVRAHDLSTEPLATVEGIPTVYRELAAISTAAECDRDWAVAVLDAGCLGVSPCRRSAGAPGRRVAVMALTEIPQTCSSKFPTRVAPPRGRASFDAGGL